MSLTEREILVFEALKAFSDWCQRTDPDGERSYLENLDLYERALRAERSQNTTVRTKGE